MNVLMVSAELAPFAKTGGLADAVTGLSDALAARGHDVRVLLPMYEHLPPADVDATSLDRLVGGRRVLELGAAKGRRARKRGVPTVYLLDLEELTPGPIYYGDDRDAGRFLRLVGAAVDLPAALDWRPDVLHCHDWHAALVPLVQLAQAPAEPVPTILTLHNIGYQGVFADAVLTLYGFDALRPFVSPDALVGGTINFLRGGLHAADAITTVSPTYAREIRTAAFGMGLEDVLNARPDDVVGILNGVDYAVWGPDSDPFLDFHYDAMNIAPKYEIKSELARRVGLAPDPSSPLLGVVSRLASQKGIDLVAAVLPTLLAETRASFVCLGSGDAVLATTLRALADAYPQRIAFVEGYDESLAHSILAGADIALVPSRYEPCGLTQMYALRYGTIPVVRATGGLADTIQHFDPATGFGNGSVFRDADIGGLLWGIRSALAWYDDPPAWARVIANAMAADFSWREQTKAYETMYRSLAAKA
jgi:starch synthase